MIDNSDTIGAYDVKIFAGRNQVNCFQCPTLNDAKAEASRIRQERSAKSLPTGRAIARRIVGRRPLMLADEKIDLLKESRKPSRQLEQL